MNSRRRRWLFSGEQIQFKNTVIVDLSAPEEQLLARMKQKTRYNIRLAVQERCPRARRGRSMSCPACTGCTPRPRRGTALSYEIRSYYEQVWSTFMSPPRTQEYAGGGLLDRGDRGRGCGGDLPVLLRGARLLSLRDVAPDSSREDAQLSCSSGKRCDLPKAHGCRTYDLWGAPDDFNEEDPLWGVFRFKEGFGGEVVRTPGAWDFPASRFWYPTYTQVIPRILDVMRWRGRAQTRRDAAPV